MFEEGHVKSRLRLYDGACVRLDIRWHNNPVFVTDLVGIHYNVAGHIYDLSGKAIGDAPEIVEIVRLTPQTSPHPFSEAPFF